MQELIFTDTSKSSQSNNPLVHGESATHLKKEDTGDKLVLQEPNKDFLFNLSIESLDYPDQFLEKYFNCRNLDEKECEAIVQNLIAQPWRPVTSKVCSCRWDIIHSVPRCGSLPFIV